MSDPNFVDLSWIMNVLVRRKWLFLIPLACGLFLSIIFLIFVPMKYRATSTIMVEPAENYKTSEINMLMAGERLALTYSEIIDSQPILVDVINQMDFEIEIDDLSNNLSVQPVENTQLLRISITNKSPNNAIKLTNTLSNSFISYVKKLSSESYKEQILENQSSIEKKQIEIDKLIALIHEKNREKTNLITEKSKYELNLTLNQEKFQTLLQNSQALNLAYSENAQKIFIIESAFSNSELSNPSQFVASSTVYFSPDILSESQIVPINYDNLIETIYTPMLVREPLLTQVISQLKLNETVSSLSSRISYDVVSNSLFVRINVSDTELSKAILINDTLTKLFVDQIQENLVCTFQKQLNKNELKQDEISSEMELIQGKINQNSIDSIPLDLEILSLTNELTSKTLDLQNLHSNYDQLMLESQRATNTIVVTEPATQANKLVESKSVYIGVILIISMMIGACLVFLFENFDDKLHTQEDLKNLLDLKPIGVINQISRDNNKLIFESNSSSRVSEDFRKLGAAIRPVLKDLSINTLLVTSPNAGEGKSTIVANLGLILARTGVSVIIVDADLHLPRQHIIFDVPQKDGLSDYLSTTINEPILKNTKTENLKILTCGKQMDEFSELLSTPYLEKLLNNLSEKADVIIIDSPPILTLADASYITPYVDGALLVFRAGITKRKIALEATTILKNSGIKYLRYILNDVIEPSGLPYKYFDLKT